MKSIKKMITKVQKRLKIMIKIKRRERIAKAIQKDLWEKKNL